MAHESLWFWGPEAGQMWVQMNEVKARPWVSSAGCGWNRGNRMVCTDAVLSR